MRRDQDANEQKYVAYTDKAMGLINKMGTAGSYLDSEIASLDDKFLEEVIADPDFSDFDFMLKEIMRSKNIFFRTRKKNCCLCLTAQPATIAKYFL